MTEHDRSTSKKASGDLLLRGYGPLLGILATLLMITTLAPTIAPEERVETVVQSGGSVAGPQQPGEVGADAAAPGTDSAPTPGAATATTPDATAPAPGASAAASCEGLQIRNDPYSPPCRTWQGGDNGGTTSLGVTGDTITVALRDTGGPYDVGAIVSDLTGKNPSGQTTTRNDFVRTYETLIEYFNQNFEFYGRKLELEVFSGDGSLAGELLGGGQSEANADAIRVAQEVKAFADVGTEAPVYAEALANQGVISTNPVYPSREWYDDRAPYAYGRYPDCTKVVDYTVEFILKQVAGRKAVTGQFAGQERKYGIIYPLTPVYQQCGDRARNALADAGVPIADYKQYTLSLDGIPNDAGPITSQFKNQGITTIILVSDPLMPYFMSINATQSDYYPEWINTGIAYMDADWAGQLYDQSQWVNSFGVSLTGPSEPARATYAYQAYQSVDPTTSPDPLVVSPAYHQLYLLAIGIQMAGPNLTPTTFGAGLRSYQSPGVGVLGRWGVPQGDYTVPQDARLIWWDPDARSDYNGAAGAFRDNGERYTLGGIPEGDPGVGGRG